jgi:hypothetical protein
MQNAVVVLLSENAFSLQSDVNMLCICFLKLLSWTGSAEEQ